MHKPCGRDKATWRRDGCASRMEPVRQRHDAPCKLVAAWPGAVAFGPQMLRAATNDHVTKGAGELVIDLGLVTQHANGSGKL